MIKLFFLEIPVSILIALVGVYSSYIVTIGVFSNTFEFPLIISWLASGFALIVVLYLINGWSFLSKNIIFKDFVLMYLPFLASIAGVSVLVFGAIQ